MSEEDAAIWIADVRATDLVDELRRRTLGRPSRPEFRRYADALIMRAVWARRAEVEALVNP